MKIQLEENNLISEVLSYINLAIDRSSILINFLNEFMVMGVSP